MKELPNDGDLVTISGWGDLSHGIVEGILSSTLHGAVVQVRIPISDGSGGEVDPGRTYNVPLARVEPRQPA